MVTTGHKGSAFCSGQRDHLPFAFLHRIFGVLLLKHAPPFFFPCGDFAFKSTWTLLGCFSEAASSTSRRHFMIRSLHFARPGKLLAAVCALIITYLIRQEIK